MLDLKCKTCASQMGSGYDVVSELNVMVDTTYVQEPGTWRHGGKMDKRHCSNTFLNRAMEVVETMKEGSLFHRRATRTAKPWGGRYCACWDRTRVLRSNH